MRADLTDYNVIPLRRVMAEYPQEYLSRIISSFSCKRDTDVESFLKDKAVMYEKKHLSRTYLIFADNSSRDLEAYFTVAVSSMDVSGLECSNELQKKMNINNNLAQSYLIGQIGKRDDGEKGLGELAISSAMKMITKVNEKVGCRVIRLDCKPSLIKYYTDKGFTYAGKDEKKKLHHMVRIITTKAAAASP